MNPYLTACGKGGAVNRRSGPGPSVSCLVVMPRISTFFGIVITMYWDDHTTPHFHARYQGHKASIGIEPLTVLAGSLPPRTLGQVMEWASIHQEELLADWDLVKSHGVPFAIAPLA